MTQQVINVGAAPNDGTGDFNRTAFQKVNANFTELYTLTPGAYTPGSVIFAGPSGGLTQDNANFFWDDTANALGIGTTSLTGYSLRLVTNLTGATTVRGISLEGTVQSDVTASAFGIRSNMSTAAAAFTLSAIQNFRVEQGTYGAGSTVTNHTGYHCGPLIGADISYSFRVIDGSAITAGKVSYGYLSENNIATGGGTTWNFFANGTAPNYMAGALGIGTVTLPQFSLRISRPITGAATAYGARYDGVAQSDVTNAIVYDSAAGTQATAFTLATLRHFQANPAVPGAGSTITTQMGFMVAAGMTGAVNNYGFFGDIPAGTGRWNAYMQGGAPNFFEGQVGVGGAPGVNTKLTIVGNSVSSAGFSYGEVVQQTTTSAVTTEYASYLSVSTTQAAAFTLTNLAHFKAQQNSIGAGSVVTSQIGFWAQASLVGGTNNYGFLSEIAAGTGRWNLYMAGSADNFMQGSLGIGQLPSPTATLRIAKNMTGNVTVNGVLNDGIVQPDVTTTVYMYVSQPTTVAAAFTLGTLNHYRVTTVAVGAGSTVGTQQGFVAGPLTTATTNISFQANDASAIGPGRTATAFGTSMNAAFGGGTTWAFFASGTAASAINGALRIGSTAAPTVALDVTGAVVCSTVMKPGVFTFATLPSGVASGAGCRAYITDCNTAVFNAAAAGGGAIGIAVFTDNAGAWKVG